MLSQLLPRQPSLTSLNLSSNGLAGTHLALLAPAIKELGSLTHLNLAANKIDSEGLQALPGRCAAVTQPLPFCCRPKRHHFPGRSHGRL